MVAAYCWTKWSAAIAEQSIWLLVDWSHRVGFAVIKLIDLILSMKKGSPLLLLRLRW